MGPRLDVVEKVIQDIGEAIEYQDEDVSAAEIASALFTIIQRILPVMLAGDARNRPLLQQVLQQFLMQCTEPTGRAN